MDPQKMSALPLKVLKFLNTVLLNRDDEGEGNVQGAMDNPCQRDNKKYLDKVNREHIKDILGLLGC